MTHKNRWTPLLLAVVFLAGCSGSDADTSDDNSGADNNDDANISEDHWDTEEERLDDHDLPKHDVVIDGEENVSEYGQEQWDLYNDGDYEREDYCYLTHFGLIDGDWQGNHPPDESGSIQADIDCLEDEGIEPIHEDVISEPGIPQEDQLMELGEQLEDNNNCEYIDPEYDELHEDD